jgi:hypothetical protein
MKEQILSKKAIKDLAIIEKKSPQDLDFIEIELQKYLTDPFKADGNKIKEFTNYSPTLFRLRINAIESYRVYFRIYENSFFIERVVPKKDTEKVLKNIV